MDWKKALNQSLSFPPKLRSQMLIGLSLGAFLTFILITLQPRDTYTSDIPYKNLKLAGYGLWIFFVNLLWHFPGLWLYHKQGRNWYLYQEVIWFLGGILLISVVNYFHNVWVINHIAPSWRNLLFYLIYIVPPYIPMIIPLWYFLRRIWGEAPPSPGQARLLEIKGQNKSDILRLAPAQFLLAQSQQNYMEIYHWNEAGELQKTLLRLTLVQLKNQIPGAWQVHRSYLVNPQHLQAVEGNARKRIIRLKSWEEAIPFSPSFYRQHQKALSNLSLKRQDRP